MAFPAGEPFHGEFASADATSLTEPNARMSLFGAASTTALTLNANDIVQVCSLSISSAATNATLTVFDGTDGTPDPGEALFAGIVPTNSAVTPYMAIPHYCQKGTYPKVKASAAGAVKVQMQGTVYRTGS
jgi:hypothetical protein